MNKRDIKTLVLWHKNGISTDVIYTAIVQRDCPELIRTQVNRLVESLTQFNNMVYIQSMEDKQHENS